MKILNLGFNIKKTSYEYLFLHTFLEKKKRFKNNTNFHYDIISQQNELKNNPIIIINQIDWDWWVCKFFPKFEAHKYNILQYIIK
jgi:hypothetical protein